MPTLTNKTSIVGSVHGLSAGEIDKPSAEAESDCAQRLSLPVQIADPAARLRAVHDDTTRSKALHDEAGPETLGSLAAVAPWRTLSALWRAGWWLGAARALPPVANLLVSIGIDVAWKRSRDTRLAIP